VVAGGARIPATPVRLYGFGGPVLLSLPGELSSKRARLGGVGGFGFDFHFQNGRGGDDGPVRYFVELGGLGVGAKADKLPGSPIFANGFLIAAGFRAYL
jgi:hypothetical protein